MFFRKSFEYLRLLKIKKGTGLVNLSDTCAVVICVNLASEILCSSFDKVSIQIGFHFFHFNIIKTRKKLTTINSAG